MTTKQKKAAYQKMWVKRQTPEKQAAMREKTRLWHIANKHIMADKSKEHYRAHRDKYLILSAINNRKKRAQPDYKEKRAHYRKTSKAKRRAILKSILKTITRNEWELLKEAWEYKCAYCFEPCPNPTQDHIIPLSKGGQHTLQNILPACMFCNQTKSNRPLGEFLVELEERELVK